jgi:hypothetical protein
VIVEERRFESGFSRVFVYIQAKVERPAENKNQSSHATLIILERLVSCLDILRVDSGLNTHGSQLLQEQLGCVWNLHLIDLRWTAHTHAFVDLSCICRTKASFMSTSLFFLFLRVIVATSDTRRRAARDGLASTIVVGYSLLLLRSSLVTGLGTR